MCQSCFDWMSVNVSQCSRRESFPLWTAAQTHSEASTNQTTPTNVSALQPVSSRTQHLNDNVSFCPFTRRFLLAGLHLSVNAPTGCFSVRSAHVTKKPYRFFHTQTGTLLQSKAHYFFLKIKWTWVLLRQTKICFSIAIPPPTPPPIQYYTPDKELERYNNKNRIFSSVQKLFELFCRETLFFSGRKMSRPPTQWHYSDKLWNETLCGHKSHRGRAIMHLSSGSYYLCCLWTLKGSLTSPAPLTVL